MANIKEYIKKVMDGTVSLEEQQAALVQVEKTIVEAKQRRDESVGQKADMVVQALKTIEAKLEAKLAELNNTPAMQGVQGPTGKAGKDGVDGKDGLNGVSGIDGKDGVNGVDGKDGISVVDAKIDFDGSLVVYLSNGAEIDCGQILSPDVAQNIIINSGGSGTSQSVTDTLASLQTQINTLTGIDGTLGTMAQQDANAVAVTGGTIDNTSIGATTPAAGTFAGLTIQDTTDGTKKGTFDLSSLPTATTYAYTLPNVTGTLAALNIAQTFSATQTFSTSVTMSTAGGNINLGTSGTTGTTIIGGTTTTSILTLGRSTVSQTTNIQAGVTASGSTKTMNIGTSGAAGSTTNIAIGSTTGTSTTTFNGITKNQTYLVANLPSASTSGAGASAFVTNALAPTFGATVVTGGAIAVPVYSDGTNWKVG
jgi:hypothetical protein